MSCDWLCSADCLSLTFRWRFLWQRPARKFASWYFTPEVAPFCLLLFFGGFCGGKKINFVKYLCCNREKQHGVERRIHRQSVIIVAICIFKYRQFQAPVVVRNLLFVRGMFGNRPIYQDHRRWDQSVQDDRQNVRCFWIIIITTAGHQDREETDSSVEKGVCCASHT